MQMQPQPQAPQQDPRQMHGQAGKEARYQAILQARKEGRDPYAPQQPQQQQPMQPMGPSNDLMARMHSGGLMRGFN
jgi:hypothetical protein